MASFQKYKTKDGEKWMFKMDVGIDPATGKRKTTTRRGFKTKKEAQLAAAKLYDEINNGGYVKDTNILFKDFAQEWLAIYSETAKISTIRARKHELGHLMRYFGNLKLKDVTRKMYQDMLLDLKKKGYADNTLDGIHTTGRMIFKKAMELELINSNPTEYAKVPKQKKTVEDIERGNKDMKFLEKHELALFLKTAQEHGLAMDYVVFSTLAYTGMRLGELLALQWKDINFKEHTIAITKTLYSPRNNERYYQLLPPKTQGSIRTIKVDPNIISLLKKHKAEQNEIKLQMGELYHDLGFVFARPSGFPEVPKKIELRMKRLLRIANIHKRVTPHSLRHTHTSLLIEAGVGIKEIQQRLGHTDIETTMNIYAHLTKDLEERASQKFGELMSGLIKNL
ncbi:site-specific integrase [Geobacillus vulcani]|uniref:site-specific integrase n=1 Tax=Geobacillus vulcani TaxID=135517 RepID=UPI0004DF8C25|nr:site-specific integrase [Geobacillus vulcani]